MMAYTIKWSTMILIVLLSQSQTSVLSSLTSKSTLDSTIHVFLSFRGADTRENMAPLLHNALIRAGFNVFMDERSIHIGKDIDPSINEAIEKSMGSVIIFSRDYASSEWCLDELVLIMRQKKMRSNYVLVPIFMDGVRPDDIGEKGGSYGEALAEHKKRYWFWNNRDKERRAAFRQVEGCRGIRMAGKWDRFIDEIVEDIRQQFSRLGIKVNPQSVPSEMDPADGLRIIYTFLKNLGTMGNLVCQNEELFKMFSAQSSIQQHHQSVQNKKNVEPEKGSAVSVWDWFGNWMSAYAFTICLIVAVIGWWKNSKQENGSIGDPDPPRVSQQQNSALSNSPATNRPAAPHGPHRKKERRRRKTLMNHQRSHR